MSDLSNYAVRGAPGHTSLFGASISLEPLDWAHHGQSLFKAICAAGCDDLWRYISLGPFSSYETFEQSLKTTALTHGWNMMALCDAVSGRALGTASYMRIRPTAGSVETGCIVFGPELQKTRAATEAMYLMARHALDDLGYRRYEWKCDNLNAASKRAALRYGFQYEGLFRQDLIVKGKNRDTAWFSITDIDWPDVKTKFETWLDPANFDASGHQKKRLQEF